MKPDPICFTKQKFKFENEGERDLEKKETDEISYTNLCYIFLLYLKLLSLYMPFSFSSLCVFAVCVLAVFFVFVPFLLFFFCVTLSIYREIPKKLFPYFPLNWSAHGAVCVSFFSTTPNFMFSRDPLFSVLLFLFVLLPFKLPLFSLWHPHFSTFQAYFHQTVFLTLYQLNFTLGEIINFNLKDKSWTMFLWKLNQRFYLWEVKCPSNSFASL